MPSAKIFMPVPAQSSAGVAVLSEASRNTSAVWFADQYNIFSPRSTS